VEDERRKAGEDPVAEAILALDVDNTLMPVDEPAERSVLEALEILQRTDYLPVLASGKPAAYLSGLARGIGLMPCGIIAENGAVTWANCTMPPEAIDMGIEAYQREALREIRHAIVEEFSDGVFLQPNEVNVTAFPRGRNEEERERGVGEVADFVEPLVPEGITMYRHIDSIDCTPCHCDKGKALRALAAHYEVPLCRAAAVGDGENDLPMLREAGLAIAVGTESAAAKETRVVVDSFPEALITLGDFVEKLAQGQ
jgi:HAD superfamily hydrolase (TIGR01484 family)